MVRVVVSCEGFDNVELVYPQGVWLSTSGCYDWRGMIDKALKMNQIAEEDVDCSLMGVAVDLELTSLDVLQDNDKIVLRPKTLLDCRSKRALEDTPRDEDRKKRVRGDSGASSARSQTKEEFDPTSSAGKQRAVETDVACAAEHLSESSSEPHDDTKEQEWKSILEKALLGTAKGRSQLFRKLIRPARNKVPLAKVVDYFCQVTRRRQPEELRRVLLRDDNKHITVYKLDKKHYAKFELTLPELVKLQPSRKNGMIILYKEDVKLRAGAVKELVRLTGLSLNDVKDYTQRLIYYLGLVLELGSMPRMSFFCHVINPYDNCVPTAVVTAHLLEQVHTGSEMKLPTIVEMTQRDTLFLEFCESELFTITEKQGIRYFSLTALTMLEDYMLSYSRSQFPPKLRPTQHHVATVGEAFSMDHEPTASDRRCAFCIAASKCLPLDREATDPPYSTDSDRSSVSSSSESGSSGSVSDDEVEKVAVEVSGSPRTQNSSDSESDTSSNGSDNVGCQVDAMPSFRPGQQLTVYERLKSSAKHANRSIEFARRQVQGSFVNITNQHLVLKTKRTNAMTCIPLKRVLKIVNGGEGGVTLYIRADAAPALLAAPEDSSKPAEFDGGEYTVFPDTLDGHPLLKNATIPSAIRKSRNLNDLNTWVRGEIKILQQKIRRQCHWYFSDSNLKNDRFLVSRLRAHGGRVPLKLLMSFNRISALTDDPEFLAETLNDATDAAFETAIEDGDWYVVATRWQERDSEQVPPEEASDSVPAAPLVPSVLMRTRSARAAEVAAASNAVQEPVATKNPLLSRPASPPAEPKNNILLSSSSAPTRVSTAQTDAGRVARSEPNEVVEVEDVQMAEAGAVSQEEVGRPLKKGLIGARPRNAPTALNFSN